MHTCLFLYAKGRRGDRQTARDTERESVVRERALWKDGHWHLS